MQILSPDRLYWTLWWWDPETCIQTSPPVPGFNAHRCRERVTQDREGPGWDWEGLPAVLLVLLGVCRLCTKNYSSSWLQLPGETQEPRLNLNSRQTKALVGRVNVTAWVPFHLATLRRPPNGDTPARSCREDRLAGGQFSWHPGDPRCWL